MTHLLIFAPNWLGDAVMALPAIADVHRASPDTHLTVAARPAIAGLFGLVPYVDVIEAGLTPFSRAYSAALLLPNSFHTALLAYRAGIPERWGYRTDWRAPLLTRAIDRAPAGLHQVEYYQHLVHALGFPNGPVEPRLDLSPILVDQGAAALERAGWDRKTPLLAIAPGAAYGGAKRWPPTSFAELIVALAGDGVTTVMVGSAADAGTGGEIVAQLGTVPTLNLIGATDLPTLAGALANCRAVVSNDSGAMHLATAIGVRVTAVFGPTDEMATGPRGAHAVLSSPVWCRPCLLRECPLDHACMRGVTVGAVLAESRRTL
jgi:heptosyltransferase-2